LGKETRIDIVVGRRGGRKMGKRGRERNGKSEKAGERGKKTSP